MPVVEFQRARKPEERTQRRQAILAAAAELFDAEGEQGAGLNAIAARAGFTKSNVYRYFESREAVLLSLFLAEFEAFAPEFEAAAAACRPGDTAALAAAGAGAFIARPRLSHLTSILSAVLERNVSETQIVELKQAMRGLTARIALAIQSRLPGASLDDCIWAATMVGTLIAGMWPGAHPSPAAAAVLARPEFARLKPSLDRDLARAIKALLDSIASRS